jgi:hypothetical protein
MRDLTHDAIEAQKVAHSPFFTAWERLIFLGQPLTPAKREEETA